jgi:hypothetical protein
MKKTLEELTGLYDKMKSEYQDGLLKGTFDWQINYAKDYINAPASVQFVKMMAVMGQPIGLSVYERALKEGPEWFPEEIEERRKWASVPQEVKDAYDADPNSDWAWFTDEDMPIELQNWPGLLRATDEDWRIHKEYYASDKYKAKQLAKNKLKVETYNRFFSEYGLTKTLEDYQ